MAENNTTVMPARFDTQFSSYPEMFKSLATQYSGLPMDNILSAFARTAGSAEAMFCDGFGPCPAVRRMPLFFAQLLSA